MPGWTEHVDLDATADIDGRSDAADAARGDAAALGALDLTTADGLAHGIKAVEWAAETGLTIVNTAIGGHQRDENEERVHGQHLSWPTLPRRGRRRRARDARRHHGHRASVTIPLIEEIGRDSIRVNYDTANCRVLRRGAGGR